MRLLIVDDDAAFRALLRTTFEVVDVEVEEAGTAEAALEDLEEQEAEAERGALHGRILLARDLVREGGHVRLRGQERARLLVDPPRRIGRCLTPHFVDERLVDASHGRRKLLAARRSCPIMWIAGF